MGDKKIKDQYTLVSNSIYDYVVDERIKIVDIVIYAAIKSQNDSGYGNSLSDVHRIFNIPYSSVKASAERLRECGLIEITYDNGTAICIENKLSEDDTDKIPKTILMSKDLDLRNKSFLLSVWIDVTDDGVLDYNKKTLSKEVFKELNVGVAWVTSRVTELSSFGILYVNGRSIQININKIVNMSDNIIADTLRSSSDLEGIVVEYESKTGIDRGNIFDWKESEEEEVKKGFNSPKWLKPIVDALDEGCKLLEKKSFELNSGELTTLGGHVKEIVSGNGQDSQEEVMQKIIDSILWKAEEVLRGNAEMKWWNKGYFTRKKNNLSVNLYYFSEYLLKYPYAKKKAIVVKDDGKKSKASLKKKLLLTSELKSSKKCSTNDFDMFDYGIDLS